MERLAVLELDDEVDHLEVRVHDDDRQLLESAVLAADLDAIDVLATVAVDLALAEHHPAALIPRERRRRRRRGIGLAPHLDPRVTLTGNVAIPEVDELDDAFVAG